MMYLTKKERLKEYLLLFFAGLIGLILFGIVLLNQLGLNIALSMTFIGLFDWLIVSHFKKDEYPLNKALIVVLWSLCIVVFVLYVYSIFNWDLQYQEVILYCSIVFLIGTIYETNCYFSKIKEILLISNKRMRTAESARKKYNSTNANC